LRDDLAVGGVLDVEGRAARRLHELAADELAVGLDPLHHVGHGRLRKCAWVAGRRRSTTRYFVGTAPSRRAHRTDRGTILAMTNDTTTPLTRPDGLIFDLDGTLVDTVRARIDGWV